MVRRFVALGLMCVALGLVAAACDDGEDGENGGATPSAASPTAGTSTPTDGETPPVEAAIVIDQPVDGDEVTVPIAVSGTANVFEAVLFVQAVDDAGQVLCERRVMASAGTGTVGTWDTAIAFPPREANAPVTIRAYSRSPRDGAEENEVQVDVTALAEPPDIVVEAPSCNQDVAVGGDLTVSGVARVFEGTLTIEIRDITGEPLRSETTTTVGADAGEFGTYEVTFDLAALPAGAYEVVAYSISPQDGSVENVFAVPVRITV